jgi:hypothetical protein
MKAVLHHLWGVMVALAVLASVTAQAMPQTTSPERALAMALNNKIHEMDAAADGSEQPPCDDINPDDAKELSGLEVPNLPAAPVLATPVTYVAVVYWHSLSLRTGLSHRPALFPPIST